MQCHQSVFLNSYLLMNVPCVEQPADSVLAKVSTMQLVLGFTKVCSARTYANLDHRCYDWEKGGQITLRL